MQCTSPRTVGFLDDGKTLCWSPKKYSKEFATFQIPCGKCIACRLENARQTAVRCVHEASMYKSNCFVTLTYNNENLGDNRLRYVEFQAFVKKLRNNIFQDLLDSLYPGWPQKSQRDEWKKLKKNEPEKAKELYGKVKIGVFGVGEYGDKSRRIHWHALIFNWRPKDASYKYTSQRGDRVYNSKSLDQLWGRGIAEFGDVTFQSAGYCARYAAKKLVHGKDGHDFEPIARRSCRQAIGKSWITKYWKDVFSYGYIVLPGGDKCGVPRYYEKWLRVHQPAAWEYYIKNVKSKIISDAIKKDQSISLEERKENFLRSARMGLDFVPVKTQKQSEADILKYKFELLQKNHKL